ncbi:MAG: tetratricopeptide repeat protein [bacterium]|nr:tetratricopeptide repeat protein [Candidatus Sumerlaeota bacterium]
MRASDVRARPKKQQANAGRLTPCAPGGLSARLASLIAAAAVVCYIPALFAGFVWDDISITQNVHLRSIGGLLNIWFYPSENIWEDHYWPLVYTSFWADHLLWNLNPFGFHLTNVVLHAADSVLVYAVLNRMGVKGAWMAGILFAVHPVHVESVAWVIERKDTLSALFYLLALLMYLDFNTSHRRKMLFLTIFFQVMALMCKSVAVTLPAAIILYHWWRDGAVSRDKWRSLALLFAAGFVITIADFWFLRQRGGESYDLSLVERVLVAGRALWAYAGRMIWPVNLCPMYPRWDIDPWSAIQWCFPLSAALVLAVFFMLRARIGRGLFASAVYFVITLSPALGFIGFSFMKYAYIADRFAYLASCGLLALAAGGGAWIWRRVGDRHRVMIVACFSLIVLALGALTVFQCFVWRDSKTLWSRAVSLNPRAWEAWHQLGLAWAQEDQLTYAAAAFNKALVLKPDYAEAHNNLGLALRAQGDSAGGRAHFEQALRINPNYADAHNSIGVLEAGDGNTSLAIGHFSEALRLNPYFDEARHNLETARKSGTQ